MMSIAEAHRGALSVRTDLRQEEDKAYEHDQTDDTPPPSSATTRLSPETEHRALEALRRYRPHFHYTPYSPTVFPSLYSSPAELQAALARSASPASSFSPQEGRTASTPWSRWSEPPKETKAGSPLKRHSMSMLDTLSLAHHPHPHGDLKDDPVYRPSDNHIDPDFLKESFSLLLSPDPSPPPASRALPLELDNETEADSAFQTIDWGKSETDDNPLRTPISISWEQEPLHYSRLLSPDSSSSQLSPSPKPGTLVLYPQTGTGAELKANDHKYDGGNKEADDCSPGNNSAAEWEVPLPTQTFFSPTLPITRLDSAAPTYISAFPSVVSQGTPPPTSTLGLDLGKSVRIGDKTCDENGEAYLASGGRLHLRQCSYPPPITIPPTTVDPASIFGEAVRAEALSPERELISPTTTLRTASSDQQVETSGPEMDNREPQLELEAPIPSHINSLPPPPSVSAAKSGPKRPRMSGAAAAMANHSDLGIAPNVLRALQGLPAARRLPRKPTYNVQDLSRISAACEPYRRSASVSTTAKTEEGDPTCATPLESKGKRKRQRQSRHPTEQTEEGTELKTTDLGPTLTPSETKALLIEMFEEQGRKSQWTDKGWVHERIEGCKEADDLILPDDYFD